MKIMKAERKNWFYSYNAIFDSGLSIHAKILYLYLCRCADSNSHSFPSKQKMITACSMGRTSAGKALRELEAARLLIREARFRNNKGQTSNDYVIFPEPYKIE
jgi:hypothetical protein